MFGVSYDTWKSICNMYFSLNAGSQKAYLQWFPFTKFSSADKENISGEEFYNSYIKTGLLMQACFCFTTKVYEIEKG